MNLDQIEKIAAAAKVAPPDGLESETDRWGYQDFYRDKITGDMPNENFIYTICRSLLITQREDVYKYAVVAMNHLPKLLEIAKLAKHWTQEYINTGGDNGPSINEEECARKMIEMLKELEGK